MPASWPGAPLAVVSRGLVDADDTGAFAVVWDVEAVVADDEESSTLSEQPQVSSAALTMPARERTDFAPRFIGGMIMVLSSARPRFCGAGAVISLLGGTG